MTNNQKLLIDILDQNGWDVFSYDMLINDGNLNAPGIWEALRYLTKNKVIIRVEKGKYYRNNFFDEKVIACFIAKNSSVAYWSALNMNGLTEQFPNIIFIQNTQRSDRFKIPGTGTTLKFIKVKPEKIFGLQKQGYGNHTWQITDIEKTIVDCFDLPQHSGGYPEIIKGFNNARLSSKKLTDYCRKLGNHSVTRRLGYLTELLKKSNMENFVEYAFSTVNNSYILFENGIPKTKKINTRWKIHLNLSDEEIIGMAKSMY